MSARETPKWCSCEGPFGCELHDPNLDRLATIEGLPPHLVLDVVRKAVVVTAQRQQCNGEVYAVDCSVADELGAALDRLARARGVA